MELIIDYSAIASEAKPNAKYGEELKILSPKQMLQRLSIVPAQVKAGNASEKLLNEMKQIIYSLHRAKEITQTIYDNIMNSIKLKMSYKITNLKYQLRDEIKSLNRLIDHVLY